MESAANSARTRPGFWGWLDDRLGIGGLRYPVPEHAKRVGERVGVLADAISQSTPSSKR